MSMLRTITENNKSLITYRRHRQTADDSYILGTRQPADDLHTANTWSLLMTHTYWRYRQPADLYILETQAAC